MNVSERIILSKKVFRTDRGRGSVEMQKRNLLRDMRMERKREVLPYLIRVDGVVSAACYTLCEAKAAAMRAMLFWGWGNYAEVLDNNTWITLWEKELK